MSDYVIHFRLATLGNIVVRAPNEELAILAWRAENCHNENIEFELIRVEQAQWDDDDVRRAHITVGDPNDVGHEHD